MRPILLTLLILSACLAKAAPDPILSLLYNTDDLNFLESKSNNAALNATPNLSQDRARSLAADLNASLASADPEDPIYLAKRLANVGILQTYAGDLTEGDQSLRAALSYFNQNQSLFDARLPHCSPLLESTVFCARTMTLQRIIFDGARTFSTAAMACSRRSKQPTSIGSRAPISLPIRPMRPTLHSDTC